MFFFVELERGAEGRGKGAEVFTSGGESII